jgi:hypothetical protein
MVAEDSKGPEMVLYLHGENRPITSHQRVHTRIRAEGGERPRRPR